ECGAKESRYLNHNYIGTEHLLLALLREQEGVAAQVLITLGLNLADVRKAIISLVGPAYNLPAPVRNLPELVINDLPAEVRRPAVELDARIDLLNLEKEDAVAECDFERAAHLRDQAEEVKRRKKAVVHDWAANNPPNASW